ncbi:MAG: site-specific DNA recombinase SpoIVCA [Polyangiales bacterium]
MRSADRRSAWVSYLRVSTPEQAERDLSLPAQRRAIAVYASARGATIAREFVEEGHSGSDPRRPAFRRMLEDALRPGSDVAVIVVHHSSRFTRDAMEARVVKTKLRRAGVRVWSVSQDLPDDPMGKLMEGFFECIDQYESEPNGVRTSAAMAEAVRQGYFPGSRPPYGFRSRAVTLREGVVRHVLSPDDAEADMVREIFRLYIARGGAKAVARVLNQRGVRYRTGIPWNKSLVLDVLDEDAVVGTYYWGRRRDGVARPRAEWLPLSVTPIVDKEVHALAQRLRRDRDPGAAGGRAVARPRVLAGLVVCGRCGASCQLETSGKTIDGNRYRYCYYSCRTYCRAGKEECVGVRVATEVLDDAVLARIADVVCGASRVDQLRVLVERNGLDGDDLEATWRALITGEHDVGRTYAIHLVDRVELHDDHAIVVAKTAEVAV